MYLDNNYNNNKPCHRLVYWRIMPEAETLFRKMNSWSRSEASAITVIGGEGLVGREESRNSKMAGTGTNKVKIFQQYIILQQGNHQERWQPLEPKVNRYGGAASSEPSPPPPPPPPHPTLLPPNMCKSVVALLSHKIIYEKKI